MKSVIAATLIIISTPVFAQSYKVQSGDSLWKIANQFRNGEVSTHKMIASIHETNNSVLGSDINTIRPGMVLDIPDAVDASQADSFVATRLLSGSHVSTYNQAQADPLILKIENIEAEIKQAIQDASNTKNTSERY